jgi:hypothetical protein
MERKQCLNKVLEMLSIILFFYKRVFGYTIKYIKIFILLLLLVFFLWTVYPTADAAAGVLMLLYACYNAATDADAASAATD